MSSLKGLLNARQVAKMNVTITPFAFVAAVFLSDVSKFERFAWETNPS